MLQWQNRGPRRPEPRRGPSSRGPRTDEYPRDGVQKVVIQRSTVVVTSSSMLIVSTGTTMVFLCLANP